MAIPFLNNINLDDNQLQNAKLHVTSSAPTTAAGQIYFDSTVGTETAKYYDGTQWVSLIQYTPTNSTFINLAETGTDATRLLTASLSATGTPDATKYLRGDNTWSPISGIYDWTVAANTGSETVISGMTVTFKGNTYIDTTYYSATDTVEFNHSSTSRTDTTSTASPAHGGTFTAIDSVTSNATGHITAVNLKTITLPADNNTDTLQSIAADSTNNDRYITTVANATGAQTGLSHSTLTYNPSTETLNVTNLVVSGTSTTINTETINLADNIITLNSNYSGSSPTENGGIEVERGTLDNAVLRWNETSDRWEFTNNGGTTYYNIPISTEYNNYIHPTHPGDDINVDTGALTGATVVSDIDINITTDTLGHVTDANGVISTRTLTLGDLGYTGATDADNYSSWTIQDGDTTTYTITSGDTLQIASGGGITSNFTADDVLTISHNDTSSQASVNNSGRTYIQDITLDTYGHITGITSATETVTNTDTQLATAAALIDVSAMGANTTASFTHGLASKNLIVQMYDVTTGEVVFADIDHTSNNAISVIFASTPTNDIRVVVLDAKNGLTDKTVSYS
jgi:hypothetical protein